MAKKVVKKVKKIKKTKPRRNILVSLDDMYRLVNKVQVDKKEVHFQLAGDDAIIADNVLRDLGLDFKVTQIKNFVEFRINPSEEVESVEDMSIGLDFFADEITEDGEIF